MVAETQSDKEKMSPKGQGSPSHFKFPLPSSYRPASLPSLSTPPNSQAVPMKTRNLYRLINSPMSHMSLMSPTNCAGSMGSQLSSRPSSTTSVSESDGYFSEVFDGEDMEEPTLLSPALSSLISGTVAFDPSPMTNRFSDDKVEVARPTPIRPSSYHHPGESSDVEAKLSFRQKKGSLKRSSPMTDLNVVYQKRRCPPLPFSSCSQDSPPADAKAVQGPLLLRSQSYSVSSKEENPTSLSPGSGEESFIGDLTKPYALPVLKGNVSDLKCVSPDTLCDLLEGNFAEEVDRYTILDCRFPYEYDGGHIRGAKNVWMQESLLEMLFSDPLQHPQDRHIFILHCEFSSKRGPKMNRFLRETDRKRNGMSFPKLFYPELYLLDGGYRAFFTKHPGMCEPQSYCCMEDKDHKDELRTCKLRSKSWHGDTHARPRISHQHHRHSITSSFTQDSKSSKC